MSKERFSSESDRPSWENLAKKAIVDIKALSLQEETKTEIAKRRSDPLSGAQINLTFVKEVISPIVFDLCRSLEAGLVVEFGLRPVFNFERKDKFIIYDGSRLNLCLSTGDGDNDFERLTEIRKGENLRILCQRQGKEAKNAICVFGRMSKKNIALRVVSVMQSLIPSNIEAAKSNPNLDADPSSDIPSFVPNPSPNSSSFNPLAKIKAFFSGKKV